MPCQHYKDALIEAAASGAAAQGEVRAHLVACAACRAAFAREQSLFSAIDSGLHAVANADVPPSLLPRVRAALDQETSSRRGWLSNAFVLATAAAIALAFFTVRALRHANDIQQPLNSAGKGVVPLPQPATPQERAGNQGQLESPLLSPRPVMVRNSTVARPVSASPDVPEVLVPGDQDALLASYAEQWHRRKRAPLVAAAGADSTLAPLQVPPIQIAQLDVKLLTAENSQ